MADIANALKVLKKSKSAGLDGLRSEHFIYADVSINKLLLMLFNSIIVHSFIPKELMNTMIIPLVKEKKVMLHLWTTTDQLCNQSII